MPGNIIHYNETGIEIDFTQLIWYSTLAIERQIKNDLRQPGGKGGGGWDLQCMIMGGDMCEDMAVWVQVDPIRCLNGFYMGVKVQNVPSDMESESIFMVRRPAGNTEKAGYRPFEPG